MKAVSYMDLSIKMETSTDNQKLRVAKKLKKMCGHINFKTASYCPIRDVMALAFDNWSILIIPYLGYFPVMRFKKLKK